MNDRHPDLRLKRCLVPGVCAATLLIPCIVWLASVGNPLDYFTRHVPPGQALFVFSKLCALLAFALLWLQATTALARRAPVLRGFIHVSRRWHALVGGTAFVLIGAHVACFIAASSLRTGAFAGALLIPRFDQGVYSARIGYGAVALWMLLLVMFAGLARLQRPRPWAWVHRGVFVVFGVSLVHAVSIGSETRFGPMQYVYAFIGLSLAAALCSWMWFSNRPRMASERIAPVSELARVGRTSVATNE